MWQAQQQTYRLHKYQIFIATHGETAHIKLAARNKQTSPPQKVINQPFN
jgi:hypothetical protein